ncbi:MAG: yfnB [Anaerocolumna sp.]|nr:yfnB [Anaerocolumna sp.]
MKKYNTILFDVDDTILDFKKGEKEALTALFKELDADKKENIMDEYIKINQSLWRDLEKGKVTRDYVLNNRFYLLFQQFGIEVDGEMIENRYRYYLDLQHECIDGATELLESLYQNYRLYIVTNGVSKTQYTRLGDAKLEKYFKEIFVSEDIGYQKPAKEYFEAVINRIPDFDYEKSIIIGDSLTADILGGNRIGIDTCWFNPHKKDNDTEIKPTFEISKLSDFYKILDSNN